MNQLAEEGFPVERVAIVGDDLQYLESVTGRATFGDRAAAIIDRALTARL